MSDVTTQILMRLSLVLGVLVLGAVVLSVVSADPATVFHA